MASDYARETAVTWGANIEELRRRQSLPPETVEVNEHGDRESLTDIFAYSTAESEKKVRWLIDQGEITWAEVRVLQAEGMRQARENAAHG